MRKSIIVTLSLIIICAVWLQADYVPPNLIGDPSNLYVSKFGFDLLPGYWWLPKATIQSALDAEGPNGGRIWIGCGTFSYSAVLSITKPSTILSGSGWGRTGAGPGCTILQPAAGVSGIDVNAAQWSILENFRLLGLSTVPGSDIGIKIHGNSSGNVQIRSVSVENFGGSGIVFDSTNGIADFWQMDEVNAYGNRGDGFAWPAGADNNVGTCIECNATNNGGWGFNGAAGSTNTFIASHVAGNTLGGYQWSNGQSNKWINPYAESGLGSSFVLGATTYYDEVWFANFGQPQTITDNGGGNIIHYIDPVTPGPVQTGISIAPKPGTMGAKAWGLRSGSPCCSAGAFSIQNDTDLKVVFACDPTNGYLCIFSSGDISIPKQKSTSGQRYLCIDTTGNVVSSATPCSGT